MANCVVCGGGIMNTPEYETAKKLQMSVSYAILEYTHRNGHAPRVILAETDAFRALFKMFVMRCDGTNLFGGIPIKEVRGSVLEDRWGIYLAGEPITIRDF